MAAIWLLAHLSVKRHFARLMLKLPDAYQSAIAAPTEDGEIPQVIALCIDLLRKAHCSVTYDALNPSEQKMALHAYAVAELPAWMSKYAAMALTQPNRAIITQLRQVKSSQPNKPKQHFGAVKRQQQLRSSTET
jgi:hypothetical protein